MENELVSLPNEQWCYFFMIWQLSNVSQIFSVHISEAPEVVTFYLGPASVWTQTLPL